jgi:N-terminal C2 in EEIG1 and EHBP1 proteins
LRVRCGVSIPTLIDQLTRNIQIIDLNNVPLICGTSYVKWHLPSSSAAEHRGHTSKALIREHKAVYDYHKVLPVRLTIDKHQMLQECEVQFEILQEYSEGGRGGRVLLGNVKINLAEHVDDGRGRGKSEEGEEGGIVRRYLMQESKINSTLKIGIKMRQSEGDTNFHAPPLKTAMVFGGIAGVMSTEVTDGNDETGHIPSATSKTRETSELQDMYRRTLAASWTCGSDELPPDKLIEDLFAGGDGGTMKPPPPPAPITKSRFSPPSPKSSLRGEEETGGDSASVSESDSKRTVRNQFLTPDMARRGGEGLGKVSDRNGNAGWRSPNRRVGADTGSPNLSTNSGVSGRESIEQQMHLGGKDKRRSAPRRNREVSEFDIREDLRSWQIEAR